jgi:4-carboxymuconolactone decarboxylase
MDSQYEAGLATRKQVMGEDFVATAIANTTPFTQPIQDHINRAAWGDAGSARAELKTRSLITVAMLTALGKQNELKGRAR